MTSSSVFLGFAYPWLALVLPLPWVVRRLISAAPSAGAARLPGLAEGLPAGWTPRLGSSDLRLAVASLAWLFLVFAAARPQGVDRDPPPPVMARDVMVAIDLSASMETADLAHDRVPMSRLDAARQIAWDLATARTGDRFGLIIFGRQAFVHTPLTLDRAALRAAFDELGSGLAGRETALGDAVALAVSRLRTLPPEGRVMLLLTDGAQTAGTLSPERAAWLAARDGVRIHAIGVGRDQALDERALQLLARETRGSYRRITDAGALASVTRVLRELEGQPLAPASGRVYEWYPWPLALAVVLATGLLLVRRRPPGIRQ